MKYVLLLRGINVGGKNKVSMSELKEQLLKIGFDNVSSYINSGNLFFSSLENILDFIDKSIFHNEVVYVGRHAIFWGKYDESRYLKTTYHKKLIKKDFYKKITIRNSNTFEKIVKILKKINNS